ncbi:MAG: spondin domain-containing protein [Cyanobacteria bacterium J06606_4]
MNVKSLIRAGLTAAAIFSAALLGSAIVAEAAEAVEVTVTIENLAPEQGLVLTPLWVGFHDGSYDLYEPGLPASEGLERIAEDGSPRVLSENFTTGHTDRVDGVITGDGISPDSPPLIPPSTSATLTFTVDPATNPYFSYASMILPSNDGFIGNESGTAHRVFDANGEFIGANFVVVGSQILDAGTEVNDEAAESVPLLGQMEPNTGTTENGVVASHPGFAAGGNVLTGFPGAAFDQPLYPVANIRVELAE